MLPEKSKEKYYKAYDTFKKWCGEKSVKTVDEKVMLAYFSSEDNRKFKASTAWSIYSMLRATLSLHDNIDVSNYDHLRAFLKRKATGYQAKKSKVFTKEEAFRFVKEAPDVDYLAMKVNSLLNFYETIIA